MKRTVVDSIHNEENAQRQFIRLQGAWTIDHLQELENALQGLILHPHKQITIDTQGVTDMDLSGGWLIIRILHRAQARGLQVELTDDERLAFLRELAGDAPLQTLAPHRTAWWARPIITLGRWAVHERQDLVYMIQFFGRAVTTLFSNLLRPRNLQFGAISQQVYLTGIQGVPIVCLIAFLISVVLAYQGAYQLQRFGADIFTIDLVAVSVLREMGVLLTAIMVAGRSGSAFAAQLGVMKINEEVDAMRAIGLDPFAVLVVPRILGLVIALPLLTVLANFFGLGGAALLSYTLLDIPLEQFLNRIEQSISLWSWWVGIIKAPFFALLIATVGTLRGMQVSGSAEDLGRQTTVAVVQSIFLVIMADAIFSILFSRLGI